MAKLATLGSYRLRMDVYLNSYTKEPSTGLGNISRDYQSQLLRAILPFVVV